MRKRLSSHVFDSRVVDELTGSHSPARHLSSALSSPALLAPATRCWSYRDVPTPKSSVFVMLGFWHSLECARIIIIESSSRESRDVESTPHAPGLWVPGPDPIPSKGLRFVPDSHSLRNGQSGARPSV